jgi:hypothetical protein
MATTTLNAMKNGLGPDIRGADAMGARLRRVRTERPRARGLAVLNWSV